MVLALTLLACLDTPPGSIGAVDGRCGECHAAQQASHEASGHGHAGREPFYEATRASWAAEHGTGAACDSCHLPAHGTGDGLSCASCHGAYGNQRASDGALLHNWSGPVRGPTANDRAPHKVIEGGFLNNSELCGTCHEITGPPAFEEKLYTNYLGSPAAARGERCQDCHLSDHNVVKPAAVPSLRVEGSSLWVDAPHDGHAWPDGASFLREVRVVIEGPSPIEHWLSTRLFAGDTEVADPALADRQVVAHLEPGASRRFVLPAGWVRACVVRREARKDLTDKLGLTTSPLVETVCAAP